MLLSAVQSAHTLSRPSHVPSGSARSTQTAKASAAPPLNQNSDQPLPIVESGMLFAAFIVVLVVAAINALRSLPALQPSTDPRDAFFRSAAWRFSQTATMGLLGIGAVWSAWPKGPSPLTVTLLILVVMITLVPVVEKVAFPGGGAIDVVKKEMKQEAESLSQQTTRSQIVLAVAAQVIAESQSTLLDGRTSLATDAASMSDLARRVLAQAIPTVAAVLAPPPVENPDGSTGSEAEAIRITAFTQTTRDKTLRCVYVYPSDPTMSASEFQIGADRPSDVYRTGQSANLQDLARSHRPPLGGSKITFYGIGIVPLFSNGAIAGIVNVERAKSERFGAVQMAMTRATAALLSAALVMS